MKNAINFYYHLIANKIKREKGITLARLHSRFLSFAAPVANSRDLLRQTSSRLLPSFTSLVRLEILLCGETDGHLLTELRQFVEGRSRACHLS